MNTLFLPLLIQVGMTLTLLVFVPMRRIRDIKADPTLLKRARVDNSLYADDSKQVANNFNNQFQLPVLFYVAVLFGILFGAASLWAGVFAWGFVAARIVHSFIHCGPNVIRLRFYALASSLIMLIGLWAVVVMAAHDHPLLTGANPLTGLAGS